MKRLLACVLLLMSLTACGGASSFDKHNCSSGGEVCITVRAEEPIAWGEPVIVNIKVSSEKEFTDLNVGISTLPMTIEMDEPENWEAETKNKTVWEGGAGWVTAIKSEQSLTFTRKLYLPLDEAEFWIKAKAFTPSLRAEDKIIISMTRKGGKVYLSGTPIPITPGPQLVDTMDPSLLATFQARPTKTPSPTMPPLPPTETPPPEILGTPAYPPPEVLGTPTDYSQREVLGTPAYPAPDLPTGQP
jgi:hypothetical protein